MYPPQGRPKRVAPEDTPGVLAERKDLLGVAGIMPEPALDTPPFTLLGVAGIMPEPALDTPTFTLTT